MPEAGELVRSAAGLLWAWVPSAAIQSGVALLLAGLADRLLSRRAAPELREAVWALALAKLVLPPTLASPLALAPLLAPSLAAVLTAPLGADPSGWALPVALVWAAGVGLLLCAWALRWRRLERRLVAARRPLSPADAALLAGAAARLGLARPPRAWRIPGVGSPFTLGLFAPRIYLPELVGADELEHVLLHELAHVARRDGLRQGGAKLLHALFWFHPLLPWARRRLRAAAEAACDRRVARALGAAAPAYRVTLLGYLARAAAAPGQGFLAPPTTLRLRLEAIAGAQRTASVSRRLGVAVLLAGLAAALLPMAAAAERRALEVAEWIVRPPGCLQLRYLVLQRLAARPDGAPASLSQAPERR